MVKKRIIFFSTNSIWGGSEVLWTEAAVKMKDLGYNISAVAGYGFQNVQPFIDRQESFFCVADRFEPLPVLKLAINKTGIGKFEPTDCLHEFLLDKSPCLAIISMGNNAEGMDYMQLCVKNKIPFITIVHLVVVSKWPMMNDERIDQARLLFDQSLMNCFVSKQIKSMHEQFLGYSGTNSKIVYNPFIKKGNQSVNYPPLIEGQYKVALLGRIENYHKGYDLLIDVLAQKKWKDRNIVFDIYGDGPHQNILKRLIALHGINNLNVKDYVESVAEVWQTHHMLLMPSRLEGQSLTLIEAMNFKRTCVVTNVGGVEELIEEGKSGFIAAYPASASIDNALERAWEKRDDWEQMGIDAYCSIKSNHPADATGYFLEQIIPLIK
ncbi:MAG: glycosyltransferase family 4 protein [Ferruginibacter sp.]